ncbi:TRPT1, partial [Symbiodinium sp. KB8]
MYGLHVVGLTSQGLAQLESHMIFQLRFVLRSYSQDTHENNQQLMQRKGFKTAKAQVLKLMPRAGTLNSVFPFYKRMYSRNAGLLLGDEVPHGGMPEQAKTVALYDFRLFTLGRKASKVLEEAGYPEFPDYVPSCGGSIADKNQGRLTVAATKKLIEGLSPCTEPNTDIADALMSSFLRTRKGLAGEELHPKLGSAVAFPGNWFKFEYSAPNRLEATAEHQYAVCSQAILEFQALVVYDVRGSLKAGKQTNQVIQAFDSVQIVAIHLRIATQQSLQASEYLMEWSGSLELPLRAARSALEALGLGDRLSMPATTIELPGGETPLGAVIHTAQREAEGTQPQSMRCPPEINEWLGEEGSLGSFRESAKNPESSLAFSISKGLAACLRHNHKPRIHVNGAGWAKLSEVLRWPRIAETSASAGDVLEVVRSNEKQIYQLGLQDDGAYFIRTVQGHSRTEVGEENLLEPVSEEQLPDT